jgi:hypothetical protein
VDGFFWSSARSDSEVHLLLATGLRGGRPGFSVVPIEPVSAADLPAWCQAAGREEGGDFANSMPGAELEQLYQLTTPAEALKLAARLWLLPELARMNAQTPAAAGLPTPSTLPYTKIMVR